MPATALRHVRPRVLLAWSALVVAGGVVAVAVEPAPAATEVASAADESPTDRITPRRAATTTTAPPTTVVDPATTAAPTTEPAAATTTQPAAFVEDTTPAPPVTEPPVALPLFPAAGRYPVAMSGSSSGSGNLVIDQLNGTDQRLTVPGGLGQLVLVVRYNEAGAELVSLDLSAGPDHQELPPRQRRHALHLRGAPVGTSWSWSTSSTDGGTHVAQAQASSTAGRQRRRCQRPRAHHPDDAHRLG